MFVEEILSYKWDIHESIISKEWHGQSGLCVGNIIRIAVWRLNVAENTRVRKTDLEAVALALTGDYGNLE